MLNHPTMTKLTALRLTGMVKALADQQNMPDIAALDFEERLGLLVDREMTERENRSLDRRLKAARLRHAAAVEDLDFRVGRGLDRSVILSLSSCSWVADRLNILISGPTGAGKTYLACALAQKACREGHSALYTRLPRLLSELAMARGDGRYPKVLHSLAKVNVLVLDDWGLQSFTESQRHDLLELIEDRHHRSSTLLASQLPFESWHEAFGNPTLADAVLDRLVHNAHKIELRGESMRKIRSRTCAQKDPQ